MTKPRPSALAAQTLPLACGAEPPTDVLARGWIAAVRRLKPAKAGRPGAAASPLGLADDWTVETLLKLGFAAPDRAYDVAVRIVELVDDPWILQTVRVSVFEDLIRREGPRFISRLSADADRLPHLRRDLRHAGLDSLVGAIRAQAEAGQRAAS